MDDQFKTAAINRAINESPFDADWHLVVDADEFVWPAGLPECSRFDVVCALEGAKDVNVIYARMWTVFRHHTDSDLDPTLLPSLQRRHGISNPNAIESVNGLKPVFTRPGLGYEYNVGQHSLSIGQGVQVPIQQLFDGAHWTNADPAFCVKRRVQDRSPRLSAENHRWKMGSHNFELTEEHVREECKEHLNDPLCF